MSWTSLEAKVPTLASSEQDKQSLNVLNWSNNILKIFDLKKITRKGNTTDNELEDSFENFHSQKLNSWMKSVLNIQGNSHFDIS